MAASLANAVALITAGSAGLGAATARAFAAMQMRVVINYNATSERADGLVKELSQISRASGIETNEKRFLAIKADVSSRSDVTRLVETTVAEMGRLDVVFSNAGWTRPTDFNNLDSNVNDEDWDRCFNMNVKSHLYLMHAAKEHLQASEGSFIMTSSAAGVRPMGSSLAYSVTKAAQIHLVKCLAVIASPDVRVNCVSPGMMLTDWGLSFPQAKRDATIKKTKLGRLAIVEDVAQQVCCFVSSPSVTGANAIIDSGSTL